MMPWVCSVRREKEGPQGLVIVGLYMGSEGGQVQYIRVSFISSLDFFFPKTPSFLSTLETQTQYNNYKNNNFHNYYFWTVLQPSV